MNWQKEATNSKSAFSNRGKESMRIFLRSEIIENGYKPFSIPNKTASSKLHLPMLASSVKIPGSAQYHRNRVKVQAFLKHLETT